MTNIIDFLAGKECDWKPLKSAGWVYTFTCLDLVREWIAPVLTVEVQLVRVAIGLAMLVIIFPATYHLFWLVVEFNERVLGLGENDMPFGVRAFVKELCEFFISTAKRRRR